KATSVSLTLFCSSRFVRRAFYCSTTKQGGNMFNRIAKSVAVATLFSGFCLLAVFYLARVENAAAAMPQAASAVTISNTQYSPAKLTVAAGTTVTWTNKEAKPHTVTADDNSFASKAMKENDTFSFKFEKPGT